MTAAFHELATVHCPDQGSAEVHDSRGHLAIKNREFIGSKKPLEAIVESDQFPAELLGRATGRAKHSIESRAISAARQNADALAVYRHRAQSVDPFLVGRPSEAQVS